MANSIIEICNSALADLGEEPISSLGDGTKASRLCSQRWPAVRDAVLRAHPWNCATAQARLAASAEGPAFGRTRAYPLPTDCLRVLLVQSGGADLDDWEAQSGALICDDDGPLDLTYVRRLEDPRLYDALLVEAFTARLSATLAYPLTASTSLGQALWNAYTDKLREARGVDAREASPGRAPQSTDWLCAKLGAPAGALR